MWFFALVAAAACFISAGMVFDENDSQFPAWVNLVLGSVFFGVAISTCGSTIVSAN